MGRDILQQMLLNLRTFLPNEGETMKNPGKPEETIDDSLKNGTIVLLETLPLEPRPKTGPIMSCSVFYDWRIEDVSVCV
jgi:hypothetical protein